MSAGPDRGGGPSSNSTHPCTDAGHKDVPVVRAPSLPSKEELAALYYWIDEIPLSRPKRNICRDFSDGVLMAEVVNHCVPRLAELHNYIAANSCSQKAINWKTLNQRVFRRFGFRLHPQDIEDVVNAKPGTIERILFLFKQNATKQKLRADPRESDYDSGRHDADKVNSKHLNACTSKIQRDVDPEILLERDRTIQEMGETMNILEEKIRHLEQLVILKDAKIEALTQRLHESEFS